MKMNFNQIKKHLCPEIIDFDDPQDHIQKKHPRDLTFREYLLYRKEALALLWPSVPIVIFCAETITSIWLVWYFGWGAIVPAVLPHYFIDKRMFKILKAYFDFGRGQNLTIYKLFIWNKSLAFSFMAKPK